MQLSEISGVVFDMDGVLWRGEMRLQGVNEFFDLLRGRGVPFVLATNNSAKSPSDYVNKLARLAIHGIEEGQILTSGIATANYMRHRYPEGTPVYVVGGDGLRAVLQAAGFVLSEEAQVVVSGFDGTFTYDKLKRATLLIRGGADYIATNADPAIPTEEGLAPGAGSILAAIQTASDCTPTIVGKPGSPMFEAAVNVLGTVPERTLMIGDRMNTDIAGAQAVGLRTVLVLTGVTTRAQLEASAIQPDWVFSDLVELAAAWG